MSNGKFGEHPGAELGSAHNGEGDTPQNERTEEHSRKLLAREGQAGSDSHPRPARAEGGMVPRQQGMYGPQSSLVQGMYGPQSSLVHESREGVAGAAPSSPSQPSWHQQVWPCRLGTEQLLAQGGGVEAAGSGRPQEPLGRGGPAPGLCRDQQALATGHCPFQLDPRSSSGCLEMLSPRRHAVQGVSCKLKLIGVWNTLTSSWCPGGRPCHHWAPQGCDPSAGLPPGPAASRAGPRHGSCTCTSLTPLWQGYFLPQHKLSSVPKDSLGPRCLQGAGAGCGHTCPRPTSRSSQNRVARQPLPAQVVSTLAMRGALAPAAKPPGAAPGAEVSHLTAGREAQPSGTAATAWSGGLVCPSAISLQPCPGIFHVLLNVTVPQAVVLTGRRRPSQTVPGPPPGLGGTPRPRWGGGGNSHGEGVGRGPWEQFLSTRGPHTPKPCPIVPLEVTIQNTKGKMSIKNIKVGMAERSAPSLQLPRGQLQRPRGAHKGRGQVRCPPSPPSSTHAAWSCCSGSPSPKPPPGPLAGSLVPLVPCSPCPAPQVGMPLGPALCQDFLQETQWLWPQIGECLGTLWNSGNIGAKQVVQQRV